MENRGLLYTGSHGPPCPSRHRCSPARAFDVKRNSPLPCQAEASCRTLGTGMSLRNPQSDHHHQAEADGSERGHAAGFKHPHECHGSREWTLSAREDFGGFLRGGLASLGLWRRT